MSDDKNFGVMRRMLSAWRRFAGAQSGVAAVEFALIAPIMILGMFGAWEYSRVFATEQKVTKIAGAMADLVGRTCDPNETDPANPKCLGSDPQLFVTGPSTPTAGQDLASLLQIADVLMAPYDTTSLSVSIFNIRAKTDSKTNVEVKWRAHNKRGTIATDAAAMTFVTTGKLLVDKANDEVIVVIVSYEHPFAISGLAGGDGVTKFNLSETTPMKPRNGPIRLVSAKNTNVAAGATIDTTGVKATAVNQRSASPY